ncbi:MAG: 30S ribosomal protein S16 [Firmicutes bacterium]|nr:30S ribosomal protein S16 [Bacillota bacterium]
MVSLRLRRMGKKKQPTYRLVAAEKTAPRDGAFIELLGHYNPRTEPPTVEFVEEKVLEWLRKGAQPSDTVKRLLEKSGTWQKYTQAKAAKA